MSLLSSRSIRGAIGIGVLAFALLCAPAASGLSIKARAADSPRTKSAYRVAAHPTRRVSRPRGLVRIRGRVRPRAAHRRVVLQMQVRGRWHSLARSRVSRLSTFAFAVRLRRPGRHLLRVVTPRTRHHRAGTSRRIVIAVIARRSARSNGGRLGVRLGRMRVVAPRGAIRKGQMLTVQTAPMPRSAHHVPSLAGGPYRISTSQGEPRTPVRIAFRYNPSRLRHGDKPLVLHRSTSANGWVPVPTNVNTGRHIASATVDSFSSIDVIDDVTDSASVSSPCTAAFPNARSKTIGRTTWYNRQESMRQVLCYRFGLEPSADFPVSAGMICGMLAEVIGHGIAETLGLFTTGACSGAEIASAPGEPTKYISAACSWASALLKSVPAALGCTFTPSAGTALGSLFESKHEFDVAVDITRHGKCIKYSPTHFGSPWLAIDCTPDDPGFSELSLAPAGSGGVKDGGTGSGGGAESGGGSEGTESGGGGTEGSGNHDSTLTGAIAVTAGDHHTCALFSAGSVACWGSGSAGQLGDGLTWGRNPKPCGEWCRATPGLVSGILDAIEITAGRGYTCALHASGYIDCWGGNGFGQLGNGGLTEQALVPSRVAGIGNAIGISAGENHACALLSTGEVNCWGRNDSGQLGDGTSAGPEQCGQYSTPCSVTPVPVSGITSAVAISAGRENVCAVLSTGGVTCWGANEVGQLGDETSDGPEECYPLHYCSTTPVPVAGLDSATAISVRELGACALRSTEGVECWGSNKFGELGSGTVVGPEKCEPNGSNCSTIPTPVSGVGDVLAISGGGDHSCALRSGGGVYCWGSTRSGALGNGSVASSEICELGYCRTVPVPVIGIGDATSLAAGGGYAAGGEHSCAVLTGGKVSCWGQNGSGELGIGSADGPEMCEGVYGSSQACSTIPISVLPVE